MIGDRAMALLLARVDGRAGRWVRVDELETHFGWGGAIIRTLIAKAEAMGMARSLRVPVDDRGHMQIVAVAAAAGAPPPMAA